MAIFRRTETPPDRSERHDIVLDLVEQVASIRGQVRAMQTEWDDIRVQIKKGYQRIEKANERAERRLPEPEQLDEAEPGSDLSGFAKKLYEMKGRI
jgi:predicted  nucleic acid-binding Zn-ribbon protein